MTMADTIAVMNDGPDRAARRRPTSSTSSRRRRSSPASSASRTCSSGTVAGPGASRLDGGTRCSVSAEALAGRAGRVAVGIRPEKIRVGDRSSQRARRARSSSAHTSASRPSTSSTRRRAGHGLRPEHRARAAWPRRASAVSLGFDPKPRLSSTADGGSGREDAHLTRRRAAAACRVRSGAAPRSRASLPASAAAASQRAAARRAATSDADARRTALRFSNWPLYIDIDPKTKRHPSLDQFTKETASRSTTPRTSTRTPSSSGRSRAPLSHGQSIDRDIIVLTDNSRYLSLMIEQGLGREARQGRRSRTSRTSSTSSSIRAGTRTASTAFRGSRA